MQDSLTLLKVLSWAQELETEKNYTYNQIERINEKPAIQRGGENLLEYRVELPLHCSLCNPKKVIDLIEKKAKLGEAFDWVYNHEYKGTFIIKNIIKRIEKQIDDVIIYAKLEFTLLEKEIKKDFEEQTITKPDLSVYEQYDENSNRLKDFLNETKESIKENAINTIEQGVFSQNLPDALSEIMTSVSMGVLNDVQQGSIVDIYKSASNYINMVKSDSLSISNVKDLTTAIASIPNNFIKGALR